CEFRRPKVWQLLVLRPQGPRGEIGDQAMAGICFDLDQTIIGNVGGADVISLRMVEVVKRRRAKGDTVILWSFCNRRWWRRAQRMFPVLSGLFDEVYTRDEMPGHMTNGARGPEPVK